MWRDPAAVVAERRGWLRSFLRDHGVQTNEVQRSWMLLPCFLELARRAGVDRLDLIELGASAGLNLVWDRYRYVYDAATWGPQASPLELSGEERRPVPPELLRLRPAVGRRLGVDVSPIDLTQPEQALLLKAFVWADQTARLERLDRAIVALRADPPELERGDVVDRVPALLAARRVDVLTVVFATAVLPYVERRDEVVAAVEEAGRSGGNVAFLYTGPPEPGEHGYWGLWLRLWPGGDEESLLAHAGFHGQWLEWLG